MTSSIPVDCLQWATLADGLLVLVTALLLPFHLGSITFRAAEEMLLSVLLDSICSGAGA